MVNVAVAVSHAFQELAVTKPVALPLKKEDAAHHFAKVRKDVVRAQIVGLV